jgi:hypothetical protein
MNFNILNPAIAQHYSSVDLAIRKLVDMYEDDYDIFNETLLNSILARYGLLNDGFCSEREYIIEEVQKRIKD